MRRLRPWIDRRVPVGVRILTAEHFPQPEGHGPNGRRFCRMCWAEVGIGRSTICGERCNQLFESYLRPRSFVMKRDKGRCRKCGDPEGFRRSLEMDHIVPLVEGGKTILRNLRMLCPDCHKKETAALRGRLAHRRKIESARAAGQTDFLKGM